MSDDPQISQRQRRFAVPSALAALSLVSSLAGCYTGAARDTSAAQVASEPGWLKVSGVPFVPQRGDEDCGAAAMAMTFAYWGRPESIEQIVAAHPPRDGGIAAGELRDLARSRGLHAFLVEGTFLDLENQLSRHRPVVVGLTKPLLGGRAVQHYEVVIGINRTARRVLTWDPSQGLRENSVEGFAGEWIGAKRVTLIVYAAPPASAS